MPKCIMLGHLTHIADFSYIEILYPDAWEYQRKLLSDN